MTMSIFTLNVSERMAYPKRFTHQSYINMDIKNKTINWLKVSWKIVCSIVIVICAAIFIYGFLRATTSPNYNSKNCEIPSNPYSEGTGHYAGYEWAEKNSPTSCGGNSQSFTNGCQEYLDQNDSYAACDYLKSHREGDNGNWQD